MVMVNVPAEYTQLSAVEVLRISISAVVTPKVTEETVMLLLAVKSVTAAKLDMGAKRIKAVTTPTNPYLAFIGIMVSYWLAKISWRLL